MKDSHLHPEQQRLAAHHRYADTPADVNSVLEAIKEWAEEH
jgi:hypothetical protein